MWLTPLAVENAAGAKRAVRRAGNRSHKAVAPQSTRCGLCPQTVELGSLIGDPREQRTRRIHKRVVNDEHPGPEDSRLDPDRRRRGHCMSTGDAFERHDVRASLRLEIDAQQRLPCLAVETEGRDIAIECPRAKRVQRLDRARRE